MLILHAAEVVPTRFLLLVRSDTFVLSARRLERSASRPTYRYVTVGTTGTTTGLKEGIYIRHSELR